ncbi:flagellar motor switch protein FliN [Cellulomonas sp. APG4]|uniref:flagellar motor switch protein FliN n=1 Tax=Cellulomonas sp. APG4 TaxID=1538656 RepID=UPI001379506C|nr:flagellar motor switch protein FliN [Cellulomonas sp. APG4]NCT92656.1 flagellar motor switch protein FliN [Cellulomonas sp. APG4]
MVPVTAATDTSSLARTAAEELARLLPSSVPLAVTPLDPAALPAPTAQAVRAGFVGATGAELVVVADDAVAEAVEAAGGAISVSDALRPALEGAAATFGPGVLDDARVEPIGSALEDPEVHAFALLGQIGGPPVAWVGVRVRPAEAAAVPQQRSQGDRPAAPSALRLLHDVEMTLTAEIGRTRLPVRQVLEMVPGTVLELDRAAGSPADVMVNGRLVARGEVVVVDEDYGIRITEIVTENA